MAASGHTSVLYVLPQGEAGGAERLMMLMISRPEHAAFPPVALFLNDGPLVNEARALGISVHVMPRGLRMRKPLHVASAIRQCVKIIRTERVGLVHSSMAYGHLVGGPAAWLARVPSCVYQHGPVGGVFDAMGRLIPVSRIIANSHFTRDAHEKAWGKKAPVEVIYPATPLEMPGAEVVVAMRAEVEKQLGLEAGDTVIGLLARFEPLKGIDLLIASAAPLLRSRSGVKIVLVGRGYRDFFPGYEAEMRRLASTEGVADKVVFAGHREEVLPFLLRMDIVVNASRQEEGFGLTVVEGMAVGKSVVAPRAGGTREIVTPEKDGLVFPAGDSSALRAAIQRLLENPALRRALGETGRDTVDGRFRPPRMMAELMAVYGALLAGR